VFKQLHEKGLVYRGFKVMPFSTACSTSLSNFEAGLNYKDVDDPAVMVSMFRGQAELQGRGQVAVIL
jgi:isoleucyl-tRNA synthetase